MAKRYEYLTEDSYTADGRTFYLSGATEERYLNERGEDGWHLSAVVDSEDGRDYYFARLLPEGEVA